MICSAFSSSLTVRLPTCLLHLQPSINLRQNATILVRRSKDETLGRMESEEIVIKLAISFDFLSGNSGMIPACSG